MLAVMNPFCIKTVILLVNQVMQHGQHLTLHRGKCFRSFNLDQILIQSGHDSGQRQHKIRKCRGHMTDKSRGRSMHRLRNQFLFYEFGIVRDERGLFRNFSCRKIIFNIFQASLQRDNMFLQKISNILTDSLIYSTQS